MRTFAPFFMVFARFPFNQTPNPIHDRSLGCGYAVGGEYQCFVRVAKEDCRKVAEKILGTIREPVVFESKVINLTVSIGISLYPLDGQEVDSFN